MAKKDIVFTERSRYGIGEWYGRSFVRLTGEERREFARLQDPSESGRTVMPCLPHVCGGSLY